MYALKLNENSRRFFINGRHNKTNIIKNTAHDVAICMALLKIARIMHSHHEDAYIDLAGYAAIAREIDIEGKLKK